MHAFVRLVTFLICGASLGFAGVPPGQVQVAAYYFPGWQRPAGDTNRTFAEWRNIETAIPRFPGHEQPKRPVWGYADEADPAVMAKKIDVAADHGLNAFIFCWYYHAQGPFIERALNEGYLHATNRARLPFALMWANHDLAPPWRIGAVTPQVFDQMTDLILRDYFIRPEYWRVDGKCYFSIYEVKTFIQGMGGIEPARVALQTFRQKAEASGCGGIHLNLIDWQLAQDPDAMRILRELGGDSLSSYVWVHHVPLKKFPAKNYNVLREEYFSGWDKKWAKSPVSHFPNVTMGWDATPRMKPEQPYMNSGYPDMSVLTNNTPAEFRKALAAARQRALTLPAGKQVVTVYAWNEWGEGGYLEPEARTGYAYLQAIKEVFAATATAPNRRLSRIGQGMDAQ